MSDHSIQTTLAHSYLVYLIASIAGLFFDTLIGFTIDIAHKGMLAGIFFVIGSLLIVWAQNTSRHHHLNPQQKQAYFFRGPYRYMRNPTQLGIVLLVGGYTIVSGSLIFFMITVAGYFISNIFFQRYEAILDRTYDGEYKNYQTRVPKIL